MNKSIFKNITLLLVLILTLLLFTGISISIEAPDEPPQEIHKGFLFEKTFHNFKKVTMGDKVSVSYKFKNTSDAEVKITDMITSCGCTVAELKKFDYATGEEGSIDVTLDTTLKEGLITKTITLKTNVPGQEEIHLSLAAIVEMPPHPVDKSINILKSEKCRLCHIEAAKGLKRGGYIYHAICWQCHGNKMHKGNAVNILDKKLIGNRTVSELYEAIAKGMPSRGMPGYLDEKGEDGLTIEQIKAIVEFIRESSR